MEIAVTSISRGIAIPIHQNVGLPNKYREYGLTVIVAMTGHTSCWRTIPTMGRVSISTIADQPIRIGHMFDISWSVLADKSDWCKQRPVVGEILFTVTHHSLERSCLW